MGRTCLVQTRDMMTRVQTLERCQSEMRDSIFIFDGLVSWQAVADVRRSGEDKFFGMLRFFKLLPQNNIEQQGRGILVMLHNGV